MCGVCACTHAVCVFPAVVHCLLAIISKPQLVAHGCSPVVSGVGDERLGSALKCNCCTRSH